MYVEGGRGIPQTWISIEGAELKIRQGESVQMEKQLNRQICLEV